MKQLSVFLGLLLCVPSVPDTARADDQGGIFIVVSITSVGVDALDLKLKNPRTGYIHSLTITIDLQKSLNLEVGDRVIEKRKGAEVELKIASKKGGGTKDPTPPSLVAPGLKTDRDALLFLLLVESDPSEELADVQKGMRAMRATIVNRLHHNAGGAFNAPGAKTWRDVIGARGQFEGFGKEDGVLTVSPALQRRLDNYYRLANSPTDARREGYRKFIEAAQAVVDNVSDDPFEDAGGSFGWRKGGSGSPGSNFEKIGAIAGNEFYTLREAYKNELIRLRQLERARIRPKKE
jgi:hypothetical protein